MVFTGSTSTTNSLYNSVPFTSYDTDLYSYRPRGYDDARYSGGSYIGSSSNADLFMNELFNSPTYGYRTEKGIKTVVPTTVGPKIMTPVTNLGSDLPNFAITSPQQLAEWVKNHPASATKPRYSFLDYQGFEPTTTRIPLQSGFTSIPSTYSSGSSYGLMNSLSNATSGFGTTNLGSTFSFGNPFNSIGLGFGTIGNGAPIGTGIGIGLGSSSSSYPFNNTNSLDSILKNFDGSLGSGDTYFGDYMLFMGAMNQSIQNTSSPLGLSNPFGGLGSLWSLVAGS